MMGLYFRKGIQKKIYFNFLLKFLESFTINLRKYFLILFYCKKDLNYYQQKKISNYLPRN